ncbi:MAG: hypothetical protein Q8O37_17435 [Sulfuricellaceae bacterium]|nr:hypothetical protein [Sulfuricellaceae bacterium]
MIELNYELRFTTPAFLGNAEQNAQWRTPPIKALLRQWWRVAYAAEHGFAVRVDEMRREEGLLFGHAWLNDDQDDRGQKVAARKSLVRIRLDSWDAGKLKAWPAPDISVRHREVKSPVGSQLYLGYGALIFRNGTALNANAAIQSGESATLSLAVPDAHAAHIEQALTLMNHYGALGGRSRNGWGSFSLTAAQNTPALGGAIPLRDWKQALGLDWPHTIGQDEKGALIWQTLAFDDWKTLMKQLAEIKIGLRTQFTFSTGKNAPNPEERHWLSYPVTNHSVRTWGNNARLPNSLRFKVRPAPGESKKLIGVIFHVPCLPPPEFQPDMNAIKSVWTSVHAFLDKQLTRIPE